MCVVAQTVVFRFKTKVKRFIIVNCNLVRVYLNNNVVAISKQFTSTVSLNIWKGSVWNHF